jgi:HD-GYP domain-containing protein (c-di-GMP phosphodiesterase class II)
MNAVEMISMNMSTLKLLESLEVLGSLPSHSIGVAIWSCLIARHVGWAGESTYFKLAVSALFHDIGEREMPDEIAGKARFELTKEERKLIEAHTFRGRDILQSVPGMPEDAAAVALQHHELVSGGGYPYSLKFDQIHPFARLISVADHFCELIRHEAANKKFDYREIFAKLDENRRDYDTTFLQALGDIVHASGDAEFEGDGMSKKVVE